MKVLFFTCATRFYSNFVIPYIYFAKKSNPFAVFEFILDDVDSFFLKHSRSLEWLNSNLGVMPLIRDTSELSVKPKMENAIRFIAEPKTDADYVYIGDVDIMILEDVYEWHKPIFDAELPYSNVVREGQRRLTGLHFVRRERYYPLGDINDLVSIIANDEELLWHIVNRKGLLYSNDVYNAIRRGRPIHGIHMSLNRLPFSHHRERVGWGMKYEWLEKIWVISRTKEFESFFATLYPGASQIVLNLIFLSAGAVSLGIEYWRSKVTQ